MSGSSVARLLRESCSCSSVHGCGLALSTICSRAAADVLQKEASRRRGRTVAVDACAALAAPGSVVLARAAQQPSSKDNAARRRADIWVDMCACSACQPVISDFHANQSRLQQHRRPDARWLAPSKAACAHLRITIGVFTVIEARGNRR